MPAGVVTITETTPAAWAGVMQVIEVALAMTTLAAAEPPNATDVVPVKPVPVMVTLVFPVIGPLFGDTLETVGAGVM